ncbi:hypothetical protein I302_104057 [Kwoniella bestiolae CBS 10118]|uniref:Uncharacterized protein n=1 Tax=Kwoniella bestiolae CBS 10118 TaxID=1296100 RepID=A0A1B9GA57_9TREE|nr:hypothetical protein I302_02762 [Kwoniella bestiolae CBS 10118]OCF27912.1 hypothetical protein I302_02762 [Kwoniella bestiolae CBS 10118]
MPNEQDRAEFEDTFNEIVHGASQSSGIPAILPDRESQLEEQIASLSIDPNKASEQKVNQSIIEWQRDTGYQHDLTKHHTFAICQNANDDLEETQVSILGEYNLMWEPKIRQWGTSPHLEIVNDIATALPVEIDDPKITELTAWTRSQDNKSSLWINQEPSREKKGERVT